MNVAVIDLGTNTFHLLIANEKDKLFECSLAAKIGKGGINANIILEDAIERALVILKVFKSKIIEFKIAPENTYAFGTSAIRNALNKEEFLNTVWKETNIKIQVIDGQKEAELIYLGVKKAVEIKENALIVDIGGGSVEFIICNEEKLLWKQSFEIGGFRLIELFMKTERISEAEINKMNSFLLEKLLPLTNAVHQYHPKVLIGSSGSFDTLNDMSFYKNYGTMAPINQSGFDYPISEFWSAFEQIVFSNRSERLAVGGMIELRVDMIVVASCLIKYLIQSLDIRSIKISNFALKEGALAQILHNNA